MGGGVVMSLAVVPCPRWLGVDKKVQFCAVQRGQDLNEKTHVLVLALPPTFRLPLGLSPNLSGPKFSHHRAVFRIK